jgi:ornithine cyclodeaminase/alanine dehydrogenase-like protein (mu-crystallin family)
VSEREPLASVGAAGYDPVPSNRGRMQAMPLLLTEAQVASLLRMEELVDLMERTLAEFSSGRALQPVRTALALPHASFLGTMPAFLSEGDALGVKLVTYAPRNAERGEHTHLAVVLLFDPVTGALLSIMDGRLITEMRTAAVSAAAARALAKPDAATLALLGSGVQARSHLEAFRVVRPLRRVLVWSPTREHREAFAREQGKRHGIPVEAAATAEAAVRGADLVVVATSSHTAVLHGEWLAPGVHVTGVGAFRPDWRELDAEAVRRARVYVDSRAGAAAEAGDLIQAEREGAIGPHHVRGEIGEVFAGTLAGRGDDQEITFFKSLGMAVEDVATARHVCRLARERGIGTEIAL